MNALRFAPLALTAAFALGCTSSSSSSGIGDSGLGIDDSSTSFDSSFPYVDSGSGESSIDAESGSTTDASDGGPVEAGEAGEAGPAFECTLPSSPPSAGSCVPFSGDAGSSDAGELDAGLDDAGIAAITNCNPLTNAGCTGTDVCNPDQGSNFVCMPAGTTANVVVCGDCAAASSTCAVGAVCLKAGPTTQYQCAQMCCTSADCGGGTCVTTLRTPALGDGVGVCVP